MNIFNMSVQSGESLMEMKKVFSSCTAACIAIAARSFVSLDSTLSWLKLLKIPVLLKLTICHFFGWKFLSRRYFQSFRNKTMFDRRMKVWLLEERTNRRVRERGQWNSIKWFIFPRNSTFEYILFIETSEEISSSGISLWCCCCRAKDFHRKDARL